MRSKNQEVDPLFAQFITEDFLIQRIFRVLRNLLFRTNNLYSKNKTEQDLCKETRGATGAPVIFAGESGKGVVLLGAIAQDVYDGPFAISYDTEKKQLKVNAGYLNRNGEWKDVARKELAASTGTVCVCTTLGSDGKWTDAEIKISTPGQYVFPIGSCKVEGESVTFCSFRVPVAIFLVSDVCSSTN